MRRRRGTWGPRALGPGGLCPGLGPRPSAVGPGGQQPHPQFSAGEAPPGGLGCAPSWAHRCQGARGLGLGTTRRTPSSVPRSGVTAPMPPLARPWNRSAGRRVFGPRRLGLFQTPASSTGRQGLMPCQPDERPLPPRADPHASCPFPLGQGSGPVPEPVQTGLMHISSHRRQEPQSGVLLPARAEQGSAVPSHRVTAGKGLGPLHPHVVLLRHKRGQAGPECPLRSPGLQQEEEAEPVGLPPLWPACPSGRCCPVTHGVRWAWRGPSRAKGVPVGGWGPVRGTAVPFGLGVACALSRWWGRCFQTHRPQCHAAPCSSSEMAPLSPAALCGCGHVTSRPAPPCPHWVGVQRLHASPFLDARLGTSLALSFPRFYAPPVDLIPVVGGGFLWIILPHGVWPGIKSGLFLLDEVLLPTASCKGHVCWATAAPSCLCEEQPVSKDGNRREARGAACLRPASRGADEGRKPLRGGLKVQGLGTDAPGRSPQAPACLQALISEALPRQHGKMRPGQHVLSVKRTAQVNELPVPTRIKISEAKQSPEREACLEQGGKPAFEVCSESPGCHTTRFKNRFEEKTGDERTLPRGTGVTLAGCCSRHSCTPQGPRPRGGVASGAPSVPPPCRAEGQGARPHKRFRPDLQSQTLRGIIRLKLVSNVNM